VEHVFIFCIDVDYHKKWAKKNKKVKCVVNEFPEIIREFLKFNILI